MMLQLGLPIKTACSIRGYNHGYLSTIPTGSGAKINHTFFILCQLTRHVIRVGTQGLDFRITWVFLFFLYIFFSFTGFFFMWWVDFFLGGI